MKTLASSCLAGVVLAGCATSADRGDTPLSGDKPAAIPWPAGLPVYAHVVIVIEENKDYDQIIGKPDAAPWILLAVCKLPVQRLWLERERYRLTRLPR